MKLERMKLENSHQSWKVGAEVGKSPTSSFPTSVTTFKVHLNFPTSARIFQLQSNFPTLANFSEETFQLRLVLSNFARLSNLNRNFPTSDFPT